MECDADHICLIICEAINHYGEFGDAIAEVLCGVARHHDVEAVEDPEPDVPMGADGEESFPATLPYDHSDE